jgi:hypothetical protein
MACNLPCEKLPTSLAKTFLERNSVMRIIKAENEMEMQ